MLKVNLADDMNNIVKVSDNFELHIRDSGVPTLLPRTYRPQKIILRKMDTVGDGTGSSDMTIDGSATSVEFFIRANTTKDIYIKSLVITGTDGLINFSRFIGVLALGTGADLDLVQSGVTTPLIASAITNVDLVTAASGQFELVSGNPNDTIIFRIEFPILVRLIRGSSDFLRFRVNDDLTGISTLDITVNGFTLEEDRA